MRHKGSVRVNKESRITFFLALEDRVWMEIEARKLSEQTGKHVTISSITRDLILSYKERRLAGLVSGPNE